MRTCSMLIFRGVWAECRTQTLALLQPGTLWTALSTSTSFECLVSLVYILTIFMTKIIQLKQPSSTLWISIAVQTIDETRLQLFHVWYVGRGPHQLTTSHFGLPTEESNSLNRISWAYIGLPNTQVHSQKWRFRLGFLTKNGVILVVTVFLGCFFFFPTKTTPFRVSNFRNQKKGSVFGGDFLGPKILDPAGGFRN